MTTNTEGEAGPGLVIREAEPLNAEAPLPALGEPLTPPELFYVRSHLPVPDIDPHTWRLTLAGALDRPQRLTWADLTALPARTAAVTLECAGNGRAFMSAPAEGTPWAYGAASTAEFTGTSLRRVLDLAGVRPEAVEIQCTGADRGQVAPGRQGIYARSLPLDVASVEDTLLAWAMNGQPLQREHGFPLRLVVPGWYGMAAVKWLVEIRALPEAFTGYYQRERYVYVGESGVPDGTPVTAMRVRSVIARPSDGARLQPGPVLIEGSAWSGSGPVTQVLVSCDEGRSWAAAELQPGASPYAAGTWRLGWAPLGPGAYTIMASARDAGGHEQPLKPGWNRYGYGNNAVQRVRVTVDG